MNRPAMVLAKGTVIRTHKELESTKGMLVAPKHLAARAADRVGVINDWVPGHGGDVYSVRHEGTEHLAVYCFTEIELIEGSAS